MDQEAFAAALLGLSSVSLSEKQRAMTIARELTDGERREFLSEISLADAEMHQWKGRENICSPVME
jgi:hypothetical protein